jgi:hypothetical protein
MQSMVWPPASETACVYHTSAYLAAESLAPPPDPLGCRKRTRAADDACRLLLEQDRWLADVAARETRGLRIGGDGCDEVHLYWNPKSRSLDSWISRGVDAEGPAAPR